MHRYGKLETFAILNAACNVSRSSRRFFFIFFLCFSMFSPFLARVAFLFFFSLLVFGKLMDWIYVETGDTEDCKD